MTAFDPYSEKIADSCALIRQHGQCEAWELFKNSENGLEVLCAIVDAVRAEAKAAVPVVQPGYALVPLEPTPGMIKAGGKAAREYYELFGGNSPSIIYEAMINAAPQVAEQTNQQEPK